jgi:hypothetical protein
MDRKTRHIWLVAEALGIVALFAACVFLDMRSYGTFALVVIAAMVVIIIALGLWRSRETK